MKDFKKPPFQQKAVAIGFTVGVHVIVIVGLLYLGMSKPPEQPKPIRTVLIKPEDLVPTPREETEFTETAHENVAKEITQTAEPVQEPAPMIPTATPPTPVPFPKPVHQNQKPHSKMHKRPLNRQNWLN